MKIPADLIRLALVLFTIFAGPGIVSGGNGLIGTKHDFTRPGSGFPSDPKDARLCVYCHTPHHTTRETPTDTISPLWSRPISTAYFTMYGTTSAGTRTNPDGYFSSVLKTGPGGPTLLCLSCHDGITPLSPLAPTVIGDINPASAIGADLSNDHPVSFVFEPGKAGVPEATTVEIVPGIILAGLLYAGRMECTSCHDVHDSQYDLRPSPDLCVRCHKDSSPPQMGLSNMAPHNSTNSIRCMDCHSPHNVGRIPKPHPPLLNTFCESCHTNSSGGNYGKNNAPRVATHKVPCFDCHENHASRPAGQPLVEGSILSLAYDSTDNTTTLTSAAPHRTNSPEWADQARWGAKTGRERGLLLWLRFADATSAAFEVDSAQGDRIVFKGQVNGQPEGEFALTYGQMIRSGINSRRVAFNGPASFADNDRLGPEESDSTPDGVCQVCHQKTRYWRADGTRATHYSGEKCTQCHTHAAGFAPDRE